MYVQTGSAVLDATAIERLGTLAEALAKRPGLRVSIEGMVNAVPDARERAAAAVRPAARNVRQCIEDDCAHRRPRCGAAGLFES